MNGKLFLLGKMFQLHGYTGDGSRGIKDNLLSKMEKYLFQYDDLHSIHRWIGNSPDFSTLLCNFTDEIPDDRRSMIWHFSGCSLLFKFCCYPSEKQHYGFH